MIAIRTSYHGPTNFKGSRVIADDGRGHRVILSWRSELDSDDNHRRAMEALCVKMHWAPDAKTASRNMVCGDYKGDTIWVFTTNPYHTMRKETVAQPI